MQSIEISIFKEKQSSVEQSVLELVHKRESAWNAKDGFAFAAPFADDHNYVVWNGMYFPNANKDFNANAHQGLFKGPYRTMDLAIRLDKIRNITEDLKLVHLLITHHQKEEEIPDYPLLLVTMLVSKTDDVWKIISFHNLNIEYDQLLGREHPTHAEISVFARQNYPGFYR